MRKLKDINYKLNELKMSLEAIENANNCFWKDSLKKSYLLTIIGQSRVLVGQGGKNMHPLLIELQNELKIFPIFYSTKEKVIINESNEIIAHMIGDRTWSVDIKPHLKAFDIKTWMNANYQHLNINKTKKYYSRNDILRGIADKHGGGHYDSEISEYVEELERQTFSNGLNGVSLFLVDIASVIVYVGKQLLNMYEAKTQKIPFVSFNPIEKTKESFRYFTFTGGMIGEIQFFGKELEEEEK